MGEEWDESDPDYEEAARQIRVEQYKVKINVQNNAKDPDRVRRNAEAAKEHRDTERLLATYSVVEVVIKLVILGVVIFVVGLFKGWWSL